MRVLLFGTSDRNRAYQSNQRFMRIHSQKIRMPESQWQGDCKLVFSGDQIGALLFLSVLPSLAHFVSDARGCY
jgi:hypothetical protein